MKKILLPALILCFTFSIFAQDKTIDKTEFEAIYDNSSEQLKGKYYRVTTTLYTETVPVTNASLTGKNTTDSEYYDKTFICDFLKEIFCKTDWEINITDSITTDTVRLCVFLCP
jgi:hypothetical protein